MRVAIRCFTGGLFASMLVLTALWVAWQSSAAEKESTDGVAGSFERYQEAFGKSAKELGIENAPSKPVWLQGEVLGRKEGCTSCHLGVEDNRFLYAHLPFRRHSGHYLEDHPSGRFGCTVCHGGVADALTFAAAGHVAPEDPARQEQWARSYGWQPPDEAGMIPLPWTAGRCAVCHAGSQPPRGAELLQQARSLIADKQCASCHSFRDEPVAPVRHAVHLDRLGGKVGGSWLKKYLKAPHKFRPDTAMPEYDFQDDEIEVLSAYLLSLKDPAIGWEQPVDVDADGLKRGKDAIEKRRCQTCHDVPGIDEGGFIEQHKIGPSLARVGEKLNPAWIRKWLENPEAVRPETAMPRFRFKETEIEDITAYLTSLRAAGAAAASAPSEAVSDKQRARSVMAKYGCVACHTIKGISLEPPSRTDLSGVGPGLLARLAKTPASSKQLEGSGGIFHRGPAAPRLLVSAPQAALAWTFLMGQADLPISKPFLRPATKKPPAVELSGESGRLVSELRCLSCHTIGGGGGDIGPELTYAGSKLKRDWLIGFLQSPRTIRPMNRARMPHLGLTEKEATTLADWIVSELKAPAVEASKPDLEAAFSFVGAAKVKSPYGCVTCHRIGEEGGAVGPELTHVGSRLTTKWIYQWIYQWIKNPKRWKHDVRMPVFDMNEEDLSAITRYLDEQR